MTTYTSQRDAEEQRSNSSDSRVRQQRRQYEDHEQDQIGAERTQHRQARNSLTRWDEIAHIIHRLLHIDTGAPSELRSEISPLSVRSSTESEASASEASTLDQTDSIEALDASDVTESIDNSRAPYSTEEASLLSVIDTPVSEPIEGLNELQADTDSDTESVSPANADALLSTATPTAVAAPTEDASPTRSVSAWQSQVRSRTARVPVPEVSVDTDTAQRVRVHTVSVVERNECVREALPEEAISQVPEALEVENAPAPPPSNPIPLHTEAIINLSGKRLADDTLPLLVRSPERLVDEELTVGDSLPALGDRPIASDLFQIITTPGARELTEIRGADETHSDVRHVDDRQRIDEAILRLTEPPNVSPRQERGEQLLSPDTGPIPIPPLPEHLQAPVGDVVVRLLAQVDEASLDVLDNMRTLAFPGGVLKQHFPTIGEAMINSIKPMLDKDLRAMAEAANVTADELDTLIAERQHALTSSYTEALEEAVCVGDDASELVSGASQQTMDEIEGAAQAAEEETLHRQENAGGAADPTVINHRKDLTVAWIQEQVTTQITNYQQAGDRRVRELQLAKSEQINAYRALVQREQYQVLTHQSSSDPAVEAELAEISVQIRHWGDQRVRAVTEAMGIKIQRATNTTKENRQAIERAGTAGREAARRWAENKILDGESWWTRFTARISRWLEEANDVNEQWRVRRTQEHRDAVAADLALIEAARTQLANDVSQEELLESEGLNDAQKSLLRDFFERDPNMHPLDFAAQRLRRTMAQTYLVQGRAQFEQELMDTPVSKGDGNIVDKIDAVVQSIGPPFNPQRIVQDVHAAMDQWGTDEDRIYNSLTGLTPLQGQLVRKYYTARYGGSLDAALRSEMSGDELRQAQSRLAGQQSQADAVALHDAVDGMGTDEATIMRMLRGKTPSEIAAIRAEYQRLYGESLDDALKDDLADGNEIDQANALLRGDTDTADAIALDEAMRGGITGLGTSEEEIERVLTRVRSEVLRRAQQEHWTSAQMEAEVRRRLSAINEQFAERYQHVEQYNGPGLRGENVLQRALSSELSFAELDLALALEQNDLVQADAARIEIERTGFYASDEKINSVLRSQFERALEARRLNEGPARNRAVNNLVERLTAEGKSEEEISRQRMAIERRMDRQMQDGAQGDARLTMSELEDVYQDNYTWPLAFVVDWTTSGRTNSTANALLRQGGRLTALQEIEFATDGIATDEAALRSRFASMTLSEIQTVRAQWEARHPGRSFNGMLRGELGGRDESDIMDMVIHGAPESAMQMIAQEERRVEREINDLTGVFGRSATVDETNWMRHQVDRLQELKAPLLRTDWPDTPEALRQREQLRHQVSSRTEAVKDAVEDHRRQLDSFTDSVTQVVGIVVGLTVAVLLGAISGGTLGAAVLIAMTAAMAATAATMATKALIKGGAYGSDEIWTDVAVGVVDALVSAATVGVGGKLLGPMKNLIARTRVPDVAQWIGRSGIAQRVARAPASAAVSRTASRFAPSRSAMERGAAQFLADGVEDAVGGVPVAFVQMALTDSTWEGDPLRNFIEGGAMALVQSVAMGRTMAGATHVGGRAYRGARGRIRSRTDVGRLLEANRLIQEGYSRFTNENPDASISDFLADASSMRLRNEIEQRGLLDVVQTANREAANDPTLARVDQTAASDSSTQQRVDQLSAALPEGLRDGTFMTPDSDLQGRSVRVEPLRIGREIVGVDVRIGPEATAIDIAMHGATIHAMQRYRGILGNALRVAEDVMARLSRSGMTVGSRGWEARLELGKLPAIIARRINDLAALPPSHSRRVGILEDIASLERQLSSHQQILASPTLRSQPGRGYVAADDNGQLFPPSFSHDPRIDLTDFDKMQMDLAFSNLQHARMQNDDASLIQAAEQIQALTGFSASDVLVFDSLRTNLQGHSYDEIRYDLVDLFDHTFSGRSAEAAVALERLSNLTETSTRELSLLMGDVHNMAHVIDLLDVNMRADEFSTGLAEPDLPTQPVIDLINFTRAWRLETPRRLGNTSTLVPSTDPVHIADAKGLIELIGSADADIAARAQQRLNDQSAAPRHYTVEAHDTDTMEAFLEGPSNQEREGVLRIGNGTIRISRKPATADNPNPPFLFHNDFPPFSEVGNRVLQLEDGGLRVWRATPTADYPEGQLMQETIVTPRNERAGHERRAQLTYGDRGREGPRTERAHAHGAGRSPESPFGILHVPREVNQTLQARGVERIISRLRDISPPGLDWHYVTSVQHHGANEDLAAIFYRIDFTLDGERHAFAEFSINVNDLPTHIAASEVTARDIVQIEPLTPRGSTEPAIQFFIDNMIESIDIPQVVIHGLPRGERPTLEHIQNLLGAQSSEFVASTARSTRFMRSIGPDAGDAFNAQDYAERLDLHFDQPYGARYVICDTRELNLSVVQMNELLTLLADNGKRQNRVVLIRDVQPQ